MYCFQKSELSLDGFKLPNEIRQGKRKDCVWHGLTLWPAQRGFYSTVTCESLKGLGLEGLYIMITWGQMSKILISNSPHKIMHQGTSHNDFHLSEMSEYITLVSERLGIPFWAAKPFGRFEIAVNLTESDPQGLIDDLDAHKFNAFESMLHMGKEYGKRSKIRALKPKIYNPYLKEYYSQRSKPKFLQNQIRCECVSYIYYLRKKRIRINTMKDLCSDETVGRLGTVLSESMKNITFKGVLPKTSYKEKEIYYFFKFGRPSELKQFRLKNERTYWRHRKTYIELEKQKSIRVNDLPDRVRTKWDELTQL